jgi:hypothetical protein
VWDNENIMETGTENGVPCDNITFKRNVAYGASSVPGHALGMILRCSSNSVVAQNTFDGLDEFAWDITAAASSYGGSIDGLRVVNNIAVNGQAYSIDSALPSSVVLDYNLIYNPGGAVGWVYGFDTTSSLAKITSWTGYESHAVTADPQFVAAASRDYHLQSTSPAIDRGTPVGDSFLGAAPDMGRYETR